VEPELGEETSLLTQTHSFGKSNFLSFRIRPITMDMFYPKTKPQPMLRVKFSHCYLPLHNKDFIVSG
jgi:hypothetical protein